MCGIVGCVNVKEPVSGEQNSLISEAVKMMRFRGPDGNGIMSGKNWIFGHARLAIIDPAAGQQPIQDEATKVTLTYNGEIYNFKELRTELELLGHTFYTSCDTEVLLRSYLEWGRDCVENFNGCYAFTIIDPVKNILFAARDRMGIKPFYYHFNNNILTFGSTVAVVLKASSISPEPELNAMSNYLTTGKTVIGDKTLLKGILALQPGRSMTLDLASGSLNINRYWRLPSLSEEEKKDAMPFEQAVETTRQMLSESVRKRLVSDVPLGAFLSGGLDSAIITTTASKFISFNLPVFCAGSDDESLNEFKYAEIIAAQIGSDLNRINMDAGAFLKDWQFVINEKGLPLSTPNEVSIYHLASALKKQCTVTLTGEGADEIFGGYTQPHFSAFDFDRCSRSPDKAPNDPDFAFAITMLYGRSFFINDTDHYTATSAWMSYNSRESLFKQDVWKNSLECDNDLFVYYENFFESIDKCSSFDKRMHLHAEFNLENLLNRVDSSTMAASVEARVPFTDHELVEFAFKMPDDYKMWWKSPEAMKTGKSLTSADIDKQNLLETKRLPRNAFAGTLPQEIVKRKKMSFPVPFNKWFYGEILENVKELCYNSSLAKTYFNRTEIDKMIAKKNRNLWLLSNLCTWWDVISR